MLRAPRFGASAVSFGRRLRSRARGALGRARPSPRCPRPRSPFWMRDRSGGRGRGRGRGPAPGPPGEGGGADAIALRGVLPALDPELLSALKREVRRSPAAMSRAHDTLMETLADASCAPRLHAVATCDALFQRSESFRAMLVDDIHHFLARAVGVAPNPPPPNPPPPPRRPPAAPAAGLPPPAREPSRAPRRTPTASPPPPPPPWSDGPRRTAAATPASPIALRRAPTRSAPTPPARRRGDAEKNAERAAPPTRGSPRGGGRWRRRRSRVSKGTRG